MPVRKYQTNSEEETIELGRQLARELRRPALVFLTGNLGAGKTTFAKGIADGLGIAPPEEVSSPTFTLVHDYGGGLFHVDLYRLDTDREVLSLGLEELFDQPDALVLIEWGERFAHLFPAERIDVRITADGDRRTVEVHG